MTHGRLIHYIKKWFVIPQTDKLSIVSHSSRKRNAVKRPDKKYIALFIRSLRFAPFTATILAHHWPLDQ